MSITLYPKVQVYRPAEIIIPYYEGAYQDNEKFVQLTQNNFDVNVVLLNKPQVEELIAALVKVKDLL